MTKKKAKGDLVPAGADYDGLLARIAGLLEQGRRATVRTTNAILSAAYWEIGRQIVEYEQGGKERAEYGEELMKRLAHDLTRRHGRGFSRKKVELMRHFYLTWEILPTLSGRLQARVKCPAVSGEKAQTVSALSGDDKTQTLSTKLQPLVATQLPLDPTASLVDAFPLPWSPYVRLMSVQERSSQNEPKRGCQLDN